MPAKHAVLCGQMHVPHPALGQPPVPHFSACVATQTSPPCPAPLQDLVNKAKKKACPSCRHEFGSKFAQNPRINTALTVAIRAFKAGDARPSNKPFVR